jgi:hypothetical protein
VKVLWVRGNENINFNRPSVWFCLGLRGSGKSSLLEHVAENHLAQGHTVFDLFGSRDGEGLAWLRSPYAKDKKILLVKGENVDVACSFPVKTADQLTLHDVENFDIIISASPLYLNIDQEFNYAAALTDLLYKRIHWHKLVYLIVREAANFYYSRLKVSENQLAAKAQMIYLIREGRHCGLSLALDSIRFYAIDIDLRSLSDYLVLKSQGVYGLASDLRWLYAYFDASAIRKMPQQNFIMVTRSGALGLGEFSYPQWHKREKEDILASVGVKVEYGEVLKEAVSRGTFKTVGDLEHVEIVRLHIEEKLSFRLIAERLKRSSRTPCVHLKLHDEAVKRSGFCPICKRAGSKLFNMASKQE